ncbi:hypothetical protein EW146_g6615, partial [Bondarzewia mesenterica]
DREPLTQAEPAVSEVSSADTADGGDVHRATEVVEQRSSAHLNARDITPISEGTVEPLPIMPLPPSDTLEHPTQVNATDGVEVQDTIEALIDCIRAIRGQSVQEYITEELPLHDLPITPSHIASIGIHEHGMPTTHGAPGQTLEIGRAITIMQAVATEVSGFDASGLHDQRSMMLPASAIFVLGVVLSRLDGHKASFFEVIPSAVGSTMRAADMLNCLVTHKGLASRVIQSLVEDPSVSSRMLIGTADKPTDVEDRYMHHSTNFHELGAWGYRSNDSSHRHLHFAAFTTATVDGSSSQYSAFSKSCSSDKRGFVDLCHDIGIQFGQTTLPAELNGLSITWQQISQWAGVPSATFASLQTHFAQARQAQLSLRVAVNEGVAVGHAHSHTLHLLDIMLARPILAPPGQYEDNLSIEVQVVQLRITHFMSRINSVLAFVQQIY